MCKENTMNKKNTNIGLDELADVEGLSVRTYNICKYNDLLNLDDILQFFWEYGNFKKIRNCGDKSNRELLSLCEKSEYILINKTKPEQKDVKHTLIKIINNLSVRQKAIINNLLITKFNSLSNSSTKALRAYLNNQITLNGFKECVFSKPDFNILYIKNIRSISLKEIRLFLNEIKGLIEHVSFFDNEDVLNRQMFYTFINRQFSVDRKTIIEIGEDYDFSKGAPVFKTVYILIKNNYIFNEKEKTIFYRSLCFSNNTEIEPLGKTGDRLGITRDRTKQIRNKLLNGLNRYFSFIGFFEKDYLNLYNLDTSSFLLNIDQGFFNDLLKTESVQYNVFFINRILSIILKDEYELIGNEERAVINKKRKGCHHWKSTYLISKKVHLIFDFEKMVNDVNNRLSAKIPEDYKFKLQGYLLNFQKAGCFNYLDKIVQISGQVLINEFGDKIGINEDIIFKRNKYKTIPDYIFDALKEAKGPLTLKEISNIINQQYPGAIKSVAALRGGCQHDPRFMCFGRSSVYGLKIWEKTQKNIKGGTMHDISEEFLSKYDTPKHIDKITGYVGNYRKNISSKTITDK